MMRSLCILLLSASTAIAQPAWTAAQHIEAGQRDFEKGHYTDAFQHYGAAFAIESTPQNALRMVIAAGYAIDLQAASQALDVWLLKKRDDAKRLGDSEASWVMIDSVSKALRYATLQKDMQIQELTQKVAQLQKQVVDYHVVVQTIQASNEKEISNLKRDFQGRLDQMLANQGAAERAPR